MVRCRIGIFPGDRLLQRLIALAHTAGMIWRFPSLSHQYLPVRSLLFSLPVPQTISPTVVVSAMRLWTRLGWITTIVGHHVRNVVLHNATMSSYNRGVCSPAPDFMGQAGVGGRTYPLSAGWSSLPPRLCLARAPTTCGSLVTKDRMPRFSNHRRQTREYMSCPISQAF